MPSRVIGQWLRRYLSHPQAILLLALLAGGLAVVILLGSTLLPVLAAMVIAYLLEGLVAMAQRQGAPRFRAVIVVFLLFSAFLLFILFGVVPLLWAQATDLARELPGYFSRFQLLVLGLPERYTFLGQEDTAQISRALRQELVAWAQHLVALSIASIPGVITFVIYVILVPLLVFFFLKDKGRLMAWLIGLLPATHDVVACVWHEVDQQLGNYVRGKFWEMLIVGVVSIAAFVVSGLKYGVLLGFLVGLSVLVPYVGATVITLPVVLVAWFQWGWSEHFVWVVSVYGLIQSLDGILLVPLLFAEVVNLHPVAIIVAVLFFGGVWGFWGVFFAIPLATLVNALFRAWPRVDEAE